MNCPFVRLDNVRDYLGAGAIGVIVGTPLLPPDAVARRDADALTQLGREYVAALEDAGG